MLISVSSLLIGKPIELNKGHERTSSAWQVAHSQYSIGLGSWKSQLSVDIEHSTSVCAPSERHQ